MEQKKSSVEYKLKALKFLMKCLTSLSVLIAILMIIAGLAEYGHYHNWSYFMEPGHRIVFTPSLMVAVLGSALLAVTLCGFVGSWKQSTCLMNTYSLILFLILLVQLAAVIMAFTLGNDTLANFITVPVWDYADDKELADEIDKLQNKLNCCGCTSYRDYFGVNFTADHHFIEYKDHVLVPATCCSYSTDDNICEMVYAGCSTVFVDIVQRNLNSIGVLGVSVMFVQILTLTLALLLAHSIRRAKSQRALLEWTMKEQTFGMEQAQAYNTEMTEDGTQRMT